MTRIVLLSLGLTLLFGCGPSRDKELFLKGYELVEEEKWEQAIDIFSQGIASPGPYLNDHLIGRANSYFKMRDYEASEQDFRTIQLTEQSNRNVENSELYLGLARIAYQRQKQDDKYLYLKKAISYSPDDQSIRMNMALFLLGYDRPEQGVDILSELIESGFENPYLHNNRAQGLILLGRLEKAKRDLDIAIEKDPQNPYVYRNLFLYHQAKGEIKLACSQLEKALSLDFSRYGPPIEREIAQQLYQENCGKYPLQ